MSCYPVRHVRSTRYGPGGTIDSAFEFQNINSVLQYQAQLPEMLYPVAALNPFDQLDMVRRRANADSSGSQLPLHHLPAPGLSPEEDGVARDPPPPFTIDKNLPAYYSPGAPVHTERDVQYCLSANTWYFNAETSRDAWFASQALKQPLSNITFPGTTTKIGVEARHYLQTLLDDAPTAEPLAPALGGAPLALQKHIEDDLAQWKAAGMQPFFVFDGCSTVGKEKKSLTSTKEATAQTTEAWKLYANGQPTRAVDAFRTTGATKAESFFRLLQQILLDRELDFFVAPYGACAQLAHLINHDDQYIDGIMGSYDLMLYDIDTLMTDLNFTDQTFSFLSKNTILNELRVSPDMLIDALLLLGTDSLPAFPPLPRQVTARPNIRDAINTIRVAGPAITTVTEHYADMLQAQDPNWLDNYQRARMLIKHHPVQEKGTFHVPGYDQLTGDNHEYMGLRLPDELMYYLTRAAISPRVLNQMTSLECIVQPPLDGGEPDEYRQLISKQLIPVKQQVVALLTSRLHRVFQHKNVKMRFWYDENASVTINHRDVQPTTDKLIKAWKVKDTTYRAQAESTGVQPGSLRFALKSLQDQDFAASTTTADSSTRLQTKEEILSNIWWLFLHLRGYIDDKHQLTAWGTALMKTVESLDPAYNLEEAAFLALELLKYDQLNAKHPHEEYVGAPIRGTETDKRCNLLISRIACFVKVRQLPIGYVGPLSRNHLAFSSIIKAIRESDRDLIETVMVSLFLNSYAERSIGTQARPDFADLGLSLPFWRDVDCAMGVAVKTYLDDHCVPNLSAEEKTMAKRDYTEKNGFLPHAVDFSGDLDICFALFDAVHTGVKSLEAELSDQKLWDDAKDYLSTRR